jgi:hypothetical protein
MIVIIEIAAINTISRYYHEFMINNHAKATMRPVERHTIANLNLIQQIAHQRVEIFIHYGHKDEQQDKQYNKYNQ